MTLEDPRRFRTSREVGACLGLVPRSDQSGDHDPQLHITKTVVAVARKLAILLHHLWKSGEVYDPFYRSRLARPALAEVAIATA